MAPAQDNILITVNGVTRTILLSDTESAGELKNWLRNGNITVKMNDYGGFEKVGELPWYLPTSNRSVSTVAGDVMLYQGNNIVIFYGTNTWSYTPLGQIENVSADEIRNFLSGGEIEAILSVDVQSGIRDAEADVEETPAVYTLQGIKVDMRDRKLTDLPSGFYIIDGKEHLIK
ncbi:MAG: hypothetical protein K2K29_02200 [Muribaculaceae bacterium]|nr:hypothetical protein [Muribaculaceae bacterium]